jgi:hypothetical protein
VLLAVSQETWVVIRENTDDTCSPNRTFQSYLCLCHGSVDPSVVGACGRPPSRRHPPQPLAFPMIAGAESALALGIV